MSLSLQPACAGPLCWLLELVDRSLKEDLEASQRIPTHVP